MRVPFSCKSRGFCPSCEARRRAAWADHVLSEVLPDLPYGMLGFTIPICLRRTFLREHALLGDLSREAYEATRDFLRAQFPGVDGVPYFITSIQTAGDQANLMPHLHCICSLGIQSPDGTFHALPEEFDFAPLEEIFRHRVLAMLRRKGRLSESFHQKLLGWRHSGFSSHCSPRIARGDREGLERIVCYSLRPPLSLARLTYESGSSTVVYRGKYNPSSGANFQVMEAKEFLALLLSHVPEPYEVRIRYYGAASSTARRGQTEPAQPEASQENAFVKARRRTWARLIAKVYGADPLRCPRCGGRMRIISFIHDPQVIERILRHLGQWDPPRAPPPTAGPRETSIDFEAFPEDWPYPQDA